MGMITVFSGCLAGLLIILSAALSNPLFMEAAIFATALCLASVGDVV